MFVTELLPRVELGTSSLPRMRSTTELKQQHILIISNLKRSGRRGSNPRPPAWKASALSTELLPRVLRNHIAPRVLCKTWVVMDSNHRRRKPADLQSAPFGHSGIYPVDGTSRSGDSCGIQNHNLLIRSQMLYSVELRGLASKERAKIHFF